MMNTETIREQVVTALLAVAPEVDPASLEPARNFRDQFDFDSIDFVNLILKLETSLAVRIPQTDYPKLSTLAGAVCYLEALVDSPAAASARGADGTAPAPGR